MNLHQFSLISQNMQVSHVTILKLIAQINIVAKTVQYTLTVVRRILIKMKNCMLWIKKQLNDRM